MVLSVYSEFLTRIQSNPEVWEGMVYALERLPTEVSNSIEAMFTVEGRKKGFLNSIIGPGADPIRKMVNHDTSEKLITLSPENAIDSSITSLEEAIIDGIVHKTGRHSTYEGSSDTGNKKVSFLAFPSNSSQISQNIGSTACRTKCSSTLPHLEKFKLADLVFEKDDQKDLFKHSVPSECFGSMVQAVHRDRMVQAAYRDLNSVGPAPVIVPPTAEQLRLFLLQDLDSVGSDDSEGNDTGALVSELAVAENDNASANATFASAAGGSNTTTRPSYISRWSDSDFNNCVSDWGKSNDEIDWDAITNGDINGEVD